MSGESNATEEHGKSEVKITVDGNHFEIHRGNRSVLEIKKVAGVPQTHVLEQVIDGKLTLLDDNASVVLKGGEQSISHLRDSASS